MLRVIWALLMLEITSRYSRYAVGAVWALVEPALLILFFAFIFSFVRVNSGIDVIPFLLCGIAVVLMFRTTAGRVTGGRNANRNLLGLVQVQALDALIARALAEAPKWVLVSFIINFVAVLLGVSYWPDDGMACLLVLLGVVILGFAWGVTMGSLINIFPLLETPNFIINRAWFYTSGTFYSIDVVPEPMRSYMLYNPLLHFVEMGRAGFAGTDLPEGINLGYPVFVTIALLAWGLILERNARSIRRRA
ncbi:MAG: ABC transporter permease [Rhodospirillaceae bacterium]|nr:ABC transporter permease [Rhodospirillaceae bacterium]